MLTDKRFRVIKYDGSVEEIFMTAPEEKTIAVFLNGEELVALMATPTNIRELAIGFLYAEGFISDMTSIKEISFDEKNGIVRVRVDPVLSKPKGKILTSGFGKGVTFSNPLNGESLRPIVSSEIFSAKEIIDLMAKFLKSTEVHRSTGGVHCSALCGKDGIISIQEDIGRHNTIDKVLGYALLNDVSTKDKMIFTTGRISSEMLRKLVKAGIPVAVSRSTPTDASIKIGKQFGVSVVGYVRAGKMCIYTHPERIKIVDGRQSMEHGV